MAGTVTGMRLQTVFIFTRSSRSSSTAAPRVRSWDGFPYCDNRLICNLLVVGHFGCPLKIRGHDKKRENVIPECFYRESIPGRYDSLQNAPLLRHRKLPNTNLLSLLYVTAK